MMLVNKKTKKGIGLFFGFLMLFIFFISLFLSEYKMYNYKITCANCVGFYKAKSSWYYELEYEVENVLHKQSRQGRKYNAEIKKYIDSAKCIKIAYSEKDIQCIRIIDDKLGLEWLWFIKDKGR